MAGYRYEVSDTDWLAGDNAHDLAKQIRAYWAGRGYRVETTVEPEYTRRRDGSTGSYIGHVVRSDMINGLPREWKRRG